MKVEVENLKRTILPGLACLLALGVCSMLFCVSAFGLDRDRNINQFHHTAWTAEDGAPEEIRAIAQTRDGYLWLGTADGLFRFDGIHFERYTPRYGGDLPSNNIYALLATSDGGMWISYLYGGHELLEGWKPC